MAECHKTMETEIKAQLETVLTETLDSFKKNKSKKHKDKDKNKELKKKLTSHQENYTLETIAAMMFRLYIARKKCTYRTLAIMKIQEQKESSRKDKQTYTLKMEEPFEKLNVN